MVTGGTGALGRAVVSRLVSDGARVAVPYRGERGFEELREAVGAGDALWGEPADLADAAAAQRFVDAAARRFGGLRGAALLTGGYLGSGPFESAPLSEWDEMIAANLRPVYTVCRALLAQLGQGASVVTVGSRAAATGGAGAAAYAVSKSAVAALTRVLALENRARGVRFNWIEPGTIDTPANRAAMPGAERSRWTPPERIAEVVAFLLSPASVAITGAAVPVDAPVAG